MLMSSSRPYYLKQRILSDHGHLSNQDSMATLVKIMGDKTKLVMHAHISNECNLSEIVELTRKTVFNEYGISTEGIKFVVLHDYKSELQELVQTVRKSVVYEIINEQGPAHDRIFTCQVLVDNIVMGKGIGSSKKAAEQEAAKKALEKQVK